MRKRYVKNLEDGYIAGIATNACGMEITEEEYHEILAVIKSKPMDVDGYGYRLTTELEWELYELPIMEEEELTEEEVLEILLGGAV